MAYLSPVIPGLDLSYKYEQIQPIHNKHIIEPCPGSLWDFLTQNKKEFGIFKFLVEQAELEYRFNEVELDITVFIPRDETILKKYNQNMFQNMDKHQALRMINYNSLQRKINMKELTSSESMKINTRIRGHLIYTNNPSGERLFLIGEKNNPVVVIRGDIIVNNAVVHITDNFLLPEMS